MKKIVAIGVLSGVVLFVFANSLARRMEQRILPEKKNLDFAN